MSAEPNPIGLYVHWPYCTRLCPYCDFNIYKDKGGNGALVAAIIADIRAQADLIGRKALTSLHFGGGTPSLLASSDVAAIIDAAADAFGFIDGAEIGLEANPDGFDAGKARDLAAAGVNRLSLGVQSLRDDALKGLGRTHDRAQAFAAVDAAQLALPNVSIDLIYARPDQALADWRQELSDAAGLGVPHLSAYQLTIEDGTAFGRAALRGSLVAPSNDRTADFYELTQEVLEGAGLSAYEVSNHARSAADQSQHNLLYWRAHDWVGVGPGAHGRIMLDGQRTETEAWATPDDYIAAVQRSGTGWQARDALTHEDARAEAIIMGVRIKEGLDLRRFPVDASLIQDVVNRGHAVLIGDRFILTDTGRLLADGIGADLAGR